MFDRFLSKSYMKYINKKIKLVYDTKYDCNVEIVGYLKECPNVRTFSNIYTLPSFTIYGHLNTSNVNNSRLITVPLLMVKYIYSIEEDYNTKKNLLILKENNVIIEDIYNLIYTFVDESEYKEIEI